MTSDSWITIPRLPLKPLTSTTVPCPRCAKHCISYSFRHPLHFVDRCLHIFNPASAKKTQQNNTQTKKPQQTKNPKPKAKSPPQTSTKKSPHRTKNSVMLKQKMPLLFLNGLTFCKHHQRGNNNFNFFNVQKITLTI